MTQVSGASIGGGDFFTLWANASGDEYGRRDAMAIIRRAVAQAYDSMPDIAVSEAAAWLVGKGIIPEGMGRGLMSALGMPDPAARANCARATYELICRHQGQEDRQISVDQRLSQARRRRAND